MGFADFGMNPEEVERRRQEHENERRRLRRETDAEITDIYARVRQSNKEHAEYRDWMRRTGRTDIPFEDWKTGRYVHVVFGK